MKNKLVRGILVIGAALCVASPAFAGVTSNTIAPFSQAVFVPCANGGAGEVVTISGRIHILSTLTFDKAGGAHGSLHFQPQNTVGVGDETSDIYRGGGVTRGIENVRIAGFPLVQTFVSRFNVIGTAGAVRFQNHITIHLTINANGDVSADVSNISVTCQ